MAIVASGKVVGGSATGRISHIATVSKPAAVRRPPAKPDPLAGDVIYKQQRDAAHRALGDYQSQLTAQQNSYNTDYRRNIGNNARQEGFDVQDLNNDFASRGLSHSGMFIKSGSDLATNYNRADDALNEGKAQFGANLQTGLQNFKSQQSLDAIRYRNEAINRRATTRASLL